MFQELLLIHFFFFFLLQNTFTQHSKLKKSQSPDAKLPKFLGINKLKKKRKMVLKVIYKKYKRITQE